MVRRVPCNAAQLITRPARSESLEGEQDERRTGHNQPDCPTARLRTIPPKELGGNVRRVPRHRARAPRGDADGVSTAVRHDLVVWGRCNREQPREAYALSLLR